CTICYLLILLLSFHAISLGFTDPDGSQRVRTSAINLADNPEVVIRGGKANRLAQSLLPFQFNINSSGGTSSPMTLVDVIYCGSISLTQAKLLAIGYPGPPPPKRPARILTTDDCKATLDSTAQKALSAKDAPDWV